MKHEDNQQNLTFGAQGVRLKHFEQVVANILPHVEPQYVALPPNLDGHNDWPFSILPKTARVWGENPGQLKSRSRAARKEGQVQNILRCALKLAPQDKPFTIVDFGGGSGHLGIPLALLLPNATIIVVDLRKRSLDLMHEKANLVVEEIRNCNTKEKDPSPPVATRFDKTNTAFSCCGKDGILSNLYSFHGPVEAFQENFDLAIALHLCGEATDVALRKAGNMNAAGIVVAPCCVGKLSMKAMNPDIYHATGSNSATVSYPQSSVFCELIREQQDWDALAKAADYSNEAECKTQRNAPRRTAKALLETDRRLLLEEKYRYKTALLRMYPWELSPKNDILVAWNPVMTRMDDTFLSEPDLESARDIESTKAQFLNSNNDITNSDWAEEEEREIIASIRSFLDRTDGTSQEFDSFIFPTRMGARKRKLIHFVANNLRLAHWCVGSKAAEKTVAVARRGKRRRV